MKVWVDGALLDEAEARISPFDHGLMVGDGVFETLAVHDGRVFALRRHLARLAASAAGLGLAGPDLAALRRACQEVVTANDITRGRVRVTHTGGPGPLGSTRGEAGPTTIVLAAPSDLWPATTDVAVVPWPRNERGPLTGLKTTSYGENVVALAWAHERGASEAVFANLVGELCEGTGTNVFVGVDGRLLTPPLSSGCLAGVTRALLLHVTGATEERVPIGALARADEAFVCSTTRDVQPIRAVDGTPLAAAPGPLTEAAAKAFADLVADDIDP